MATAAADAVVVEVGGAGAVAGFFSGAAAGFCSTTVLALFSTFFTRPWTFP